MIDLLTLDCGCVFDNGSWDVCLFHRYRDGAMDKDGPIPLSGFDNEPTPIFNAPSMAAEPYEASTRQAKAEREAPTANHCPTCTCKKER